jgi:hypothetical protein
VYITYLRAGLFYMNGDFFSFLFYEDGSIRRCFSPFYYSKPFNLMLLSFPRPSFFLPFLSFPPPSLFLSEISHYYHHKHIGTPTFYLYHMPPVRTCSLISSTSQALSKKKTSPCSFLLSCFSLFVVYNV